MFLINGLTVELNGNISTTSRNSVLSSFSVRRLWLYYLGIKFGSVHINLYGFRAVSISLQRSDKHQICHIFLSTLLSNRIICFAANH